MALVLATLVLFAGWTGATSTPASSTSAIFLAAPVPTTFFCVLCPKISTGLEKLAPTGWHGWHVFATLWPTWMESALPAEWANQLWDGRGDGCLEEREAGKVAECDWGAAGTGKQLVVVN